MEQEKIGKLLVVLASLLSLLALLACAGCNRTTKETPKALADFTGTYALVSIDGQSVPCTVHHEGHDLPVQSGAFIIHPDGTCVSQITLAGRELPMEVKATYEQQGATLTMKWAGAGMTTGKLEGNTFTMVNEGMSLAYRK